ncbi:MAG: ATP-binding protein [Chitinophagaceae bacterium]
MRKDVFILLAFLALLPFLTAGQTKKIDSLKRQAHLTVPAPERLNAIFALCDQGYTLHPDTLLLYSEQAQAIAKDLRRKNDEVKAMYYISFALTNKGLIDSSLAIADRCLQLLATMGNDPLLKGNLLNQKGRCFMRKNQYKEAIDMGYQVIEGAEKSRDTLLQMKGKTLIGWAYLEIGQTKEALKWHLNALSTTADTLMLEQYSILFANLAINYNGIGKPDSAFYYINKAIAYSRRNENLFALSNSLAIQAQIFVRTDQAILAEAPLKETVEIRKIIGDPFYIVSDMSQLGLYYANNGQPDKGIEICKEGIAIANEYKMDTKLFFLYGTLAENYKAAGDFSKYAETLESIISLKDSVYQKNSATALAEMQTKYELQRKENTIIQQELDLTKKNYLFYGAVLFSILAAVAGYFIFRAYQRKQKIKMQLAVEKEKRLSEKAINEAEEKERKRIAADLHDNLGAYAASMASNLDYIQVQQTNTTSSDMFRELRNNSMAIISQLNDTIWVLKKDELSLTAISDRIKVFISRIRPSYPDINIDVKEKIAYDHRLSSSQAFHLYRIVQEAISNALKHSKANGIVIRIAGDQKTWLVTVTDNGKGMNGIQDASGGNGLVNMQKRSAEAGWNIDWASNGGGTSVTIAPTTN